MKVKYIVAHGTYTPVGMEVTPDDIEQWHVKERGWSKPGYHAIIQPSGRIQAILDWDEPGIHVGEFNPISLGFALIGGKGPDGWRFNYTVEQMTALETLFLQAKAKFPEAKIVGHGDLDEENPCPGFDVGRMFGWIR